MYIFTGLFFAAIYPFGFLCMDICFFCHDGIPSIKEKRQKVATEYISMPFFLNDCSVNENIIQCQFQILSESVWVGRPQVSGLIRS